MLPQQEEAVIRRESVDRKGQVRVTFELPLDPWVERVNLVGEFNAWDTRSTPMTREGADAHWKVTVELEAGRCYRFRYLVDGEKWLNDWQADDYVENPYGSDDSVLDLTEYGEPSPS
jgi:1,4-alpha-glucan branching enzyme